MGCFNVTKELLDLIYLSAQGLLVPGAAVPWVENMFTPGSYCESAYARMRDAYERLCTRLGVDVDDEDDDLNCMMESLENIQEVLCKEMFELGVTYAESIRTEG